MDCDSQWVRARRRPTQGLAQRVGLRYFDLRKRSDHKLARFPPQRGVAFRMADFIEITFAFQLLPSYFFLRPG
jgi:hypothetical protein